jgi:hypothetical protein
MAQTNAALLSGGKAPVLLLPWFELIAVENLPHRFVADGLDDLEFHEFVGQQAQTPAGIALRRGFTTQGHQLSLLTGIKFALTRPFKAGFAQQRLPAASTIFTTCPFHGKHTYFQDSGDFSIAPPSMLCVLIGPQQNARTALALGAANTNLHPSFQPLTSLSFQGNAIFFAHPPSPSASHVMTQSK